jgi:hypothetical protein
MQVVWGTTQTCLDFYYQGKVTQGQLFQLALTWRNGATGNLGWGGAAPKLEPTLRGSLAYIFGQLFQRRGRPKDEVLMFFRTALKDAPAASPMQRLAQQEVTRLAGKEEMLDK